MRQTLVRLFLQHPRDVKESYFEHMGASAHYGLRLLGAAGAAFTHALVPGLCQTRASDTVRAMACELNGRAETAMRNRMHAAGTYDPGL